MPLGKIALISAAFFAVAREGLETALFVYSNFKTVSDDSSPAIGLVLGLALAVALGIAIYRQSLKINLGKFFTVTGIALIVIAANLSSLESTFDADQAVRVEQMIFEKLGKIYSMSTAEFQTLAREYQSFIARVNYPSKNLVYGMSKAMFEKYKLNDFQDDYFRRMQAPNPLFLKRMDEVMANFIWNWDAFFKKYKMNQILHLLH
jgi:FTR1 family protein